MNHQGAHPGWDDALASALRRALPAPPLPRDFRARLAAARSAAELGDRDASAALRARLEREQREQLAELENEFVRVRRGTLGTLLGVAFAAGAAAAVAMPWLRAHLGSHVHVAITWGGVAVGLGIVAVSLGGWLQTPNR